MPNLARFAIAAAIVLALGGFALSRAFAPSTNVGNTPTPTPTAEPTRSPGWTDRFPAASNTTFGHPFTYAIDPGSGLIARNGDATSQLFDATDPVTRDIRGRIVLKVVDGVRQDVCTASGGQILRNLTSRALGDYFARLQGNRVVEEPTTVDGRPAIVIDITQLPASSRPCKDEWVWSESADNGLAPFTDVGDGWTRRIVAFDVGGEVVVAIVMAPEAAMPAWVTTASAFLDTLRFNDSASPNPSAP
jgi:hypothetical protein